MPFGMGFGDLALILIIVVVAFGGTKLPGSQETLGRVLPGQDLPPARLLFVRRHRWTRWDWATACLAGLLAIATLVLALHGRD
jgi:hypothetical protein